MKPQILISILCILIFVGCSKADEKIYSEDSPLTSYSYIEFLKSDGTHFQEGEIEFMNAVTNSEGDTIYSDWTVLKLPDGIDYQTELDHIFFKGLEVAFYMDEILSEGEEWDKNAMYWFKYLDSDIIDYFRVNDKGVYQEYREISIYLNEEPIEPIHQSEGGENFFFQFIKNEF